jgi:hypothetical protein
MIPMTLQFSALYRRSCNEVDNKGAEKKRFAKNDTSVDLVDRHGTLWKLMTPLRVATDTVDKLRGKHTDSERAQHEQDKEVLANEVKESIRQFYGSELGEKILRKVPMGKDSWVGPEDIIKAKQKAGIPQSSFDLLQLIEGRGMITLQCPRLNILTPESRNTFFANLRDWAVSQPTFKTGELTQQNLLGEAAASLEHFATHEAVDQFRGACQSWLTRHSPHELLGHPISADQAQELLSRVEQTGAAEAHTCREGFDGYVAAEARKLVSTQQISLGFEALSRPGPERNELVAALEQQARPSSDAHISRVLEATRTNLAKLYVAIGPLLMNHPATYIMRHLATEEDCKKMSPS